MKKCRNCGALIEDNSIFCEECGHRFGLNPFDAYKIDMIENESIIRKSEINIGSLAAPIILTFIGLIVAIINMQFMYYPIFSFLNPFFIIGIIWLIIRLIAYFNTELILTNKRVFGKCGMISTIHMQCPLNKINSVTFSNSILGKLFGYGTVNIATASTQFKFRFITDGQTFYNDIFNHFEKANREKMLENANAIAEAIKKVM